MSSSCSLHYPDYTGIDQLQLCQNRLALNGEFDGACANCVVAHSSHTTHQRLVVRKLLQFNITLLIAVQRALAEVETSTISASLLHSLAASSLRVP